MTDLFSVPLRAVIFDMDGVLTDTIDYHYRTWQRLFDEENIPFNREQNEALRGLSRLDSLNAVLGDRPISDAKKQEFLDRKNQYFHEFIEQMDETALLPGIAHLLPEIKAAGLPMAVASASQNVIKVCTQLGIADMFDAIANVYDVPNSKPAPDVFLHAAQLIDVEPNACLVIEDGGSGIAAALAAGMRVLGLGSPEIVGAAHVVLPDLAGVTWADLRDRFETPGVASSNVVSSVGR
jgi:beta-phosphoglucomutase